MVSGDGACDEERHGANTTRWYRWGDSSVTPSVKGMTHQRLAYEDLSSPTQMTHDCLAAEHNLAVAEQRPDTTHPALADFRSEAPQITPDLADLAAGLELHFG